MTSQDILVNILPFHHIIYFNITVHHFTVHYMYEGQLHHTYNKGRKLCLS